MGWFNKKEKEQDRNSSLPELPEFESVPQPVISQLPSFPNNPLAEKFSQSTIKEAVSGGKEVWGDQRVNEFEEDRNQRMPEPPQIEHGPKKFVREAFEKPEPRIKKIGKKEEKIFIRLDKFEDSLHNIREIQDRIEEIEKILEETKGIKDRENAEIAEWEKATIELKTKIERVERDIVSKVD